MKQPPRPKSEVVSDPCDLDDGSLRRVITDEELEWLRTHRCPIGADDEPFGNSE